MKKNLLLVLALVAVLSLAACNNNTTTTTPTPTATTAPTEAPTSEPTAAPTEAPVFDPAAKSEGVMTHAQYAAAAADDAVVIECYVQATQSWYKDAIVVYAADPDGAYFIYNMVCSEEDAAKLVPGTKIKVTGYKTFYSGEGEVAKGATFEFEEGSYIVSTPEDLTSAFAANDNDALLAKQNVLFSVKNAVVVPSTDADGNSVAWLYKYNGAGAEGDDLYFNVQIDGVPYTFTVESYLCGADTDVYKAVKNLKIGDTIDLTGFLYWYNGANPHTTAVTVTGNIAAKSEGVMTYEQYNAAAVDDAIVIECFVQATQSWYKDSIVVYAADFDGAYFAYQVACSQEDAAKLVPGTKIKITGYKTEYAGLFEVAKGATFEFEEGKYVVSKAQDLTNAFAAKDEAALLAKQNVLFTVKDAKIVASKDADGNEVAWLYKYNGSGAEGDDLYFNVQIGEVTYTFTVESYLCGTETEIYKAVKELTIGATVDLTGYLYWYNGANPHIIGMSLK